MISWSLFEQTLVNRTIDPDLGVIVGVTYLRVVVCVSVNLPRLRNEFLLVAPAPCRNLSTTTIGAAGSSVVTIRELLEHFLVFRTENRNLCLTVDVLDS